MSIYIYIYTLNNITCLICEILIYYFELLNVIANYIILLYYILIIYARVKRIKKKHVVKRKSSNKYVIGSSKNDNNIRTVC